ncbi:type IV pilus twitching motility protein PilT [Candidatus Dependentiae bacterium]|nr:type IV pilus twitching motility protein PilT [Candidatus Dependentiae bacterium]
MYMHDLMQFANDMGASDIHITPGRPPVVRIDGGLRDVEGAEILTGDDTELLVRSITPDSHIPIIEEKGGTDFGYAFRDICRFRVSILRTKGKYAMVLRRIPSKIYSLEELGVPPKFKELLKRPRGLILVTGPTGSGKTTTLAAMIDHINKERDAHIITIEDPIEYYFPHIMSIVNQREVGVDVISFAGAIRGALRQDPDVILVGEMRDLETIGTAITAAETGHLVFGTLHTNSAPKTVDRIIDAFPTDAQEQIRSQLASSLIAVISQTLMPKARGGGRVAGFEIMIGTPGIANLIREHKTYNLLSAIQTGQQLGMQTLDQHLLNLYQRRTITYEMAIERAQDIEEMKKNM